MRPAALPLTGFAALASEIEWLAATEARTVEIIETNQARLPDTLWPVGLTQAKATAKTLAEVAALLRALAAHEGHVRTLITPAKEAARR